MKKLFFSLLAVSTFINTFAQEYYKDGTRITVDGITYQVRKRMELFLLSNISNHLLNENWQYRDETVIEFDSDNIDYLSSHATFDWELMKKVLKETFTEAEYNRLCKADRSGFEVFYAIDGNGNILEVSFIINARMNPELARVPPEKYALLEKNIRKYIKWETNEYAKKFKFLHAFSQLDFPDLPIDYKKTGPGIYTKPVS